MIAVRPATPSDASAIASLERVVFGADAWSSAQVEEELAAPHRHAVVAEDSDVIGYAFSLQGGDLADLLRIAVAPAFRRSGVAARLFGRLREAAVVDGAVRMLLEVSADNAGALAFYGAHGFAEIDRRAGYYRDGSDALVLSADLKPLDEGVR